MVKALETNAILQKQELVKEATADAQVVDRLTKEFTVSAQAVDRSTKAYSVDSVLQKEQTRTATIDAQLIVRLTTMFTVGAHLGRNKEFTADAHLTTELTKAVMATLVLDSPLNRILSADSHLHSGAINRDSKLGSREVGLFQTSQ